MNIESVEELTLGEIVRGVLIEKREALCLVRPVSSTRKSGVICLMFTAAAARDLGPGLKGMAAPGVNAIEVDLNLPAAALLEWMTLRRRRSGLGEILFPVEKRFLVAAFVGNYVGKSVAKFLVRKGVHCLTI